MRKNLKRILSIKTVFCAFLILLSFDCALAQRKEAELNAIVPRTFRDCKNLTVFCYEEKEQLPVQKVENSSGDDVAVENEQKKSLSDLIEAGIKTDIETSIKETSIKETKLDEADIKNLSDGKPSYQKEVKEKFHWKPALIQSGIFLGIQHGFRMTQAKTRRELDGPFFRDWARSVKGLRGWKDPDNFFTNYVAHPLQGGLTGRIFVVNSDNAKKQEFGKSKEYWRSRLKAMVWSAAWSTQFELGPISEASIGNVGIRDKRGRPTMAWGDLVVTPTIGTGVLIAEDAIDRYILKNWIEKKVNSKFLIKMFRIMFTPTTSFSNVLRAQRPSKRDYRPL
ncbi:MAG TPA: hypothetical protein VF596_19675 [Pyrinomonadaceae bacterium]